MNTSQDHLAVWFILLFTVHVSAQQAVLVDDFARADSLLQLGFLEIPTPPQLIVARRELALDDVQLLYARQ